MRAHEHPHPRLFFRFLSGETSKSENRAIVRHLLHGCRPCAGTTRPLWGFVERARAEKEAAWESGTA